MLEQQTAPTIQQEGIDWLSLAEFLGNQFAAREAEADESDLFVADNIARLKASGLVTAGVPIELGGGGASYTDLCAADFKTLFQFHGAGVFYAYASGHDSNLALAQSECSSGWIIQTSGNGVTDHAQQWRIGLVAERWHSYQSGGWISDHRSQSIC